MEGTGLALMSPTAYIFGVSFSNVGAVLYHRLISIL
jgi:hypothetical protein